MYTTFGSRRETLAYPKKEIEHAPPDVNRLTGRTDSTTAQTARWSVALSTEDDQTGRWEHRPCTKVLVLQELARIIHD